MCYKTTYTCPFSSPLLWQKNTAMETWSRVFTEEGAQALLDSSDLNTLTGSGIKFAGHTLSLQCDTVISHQHSTLLKDQGTWGAWLVIFHWVINSTDHEYVQLTCAHQLCSVKMIKVELVQKTHRQHKTWMNHKVCVSMNHKDQERDWKERTHNITERRESYRK